MHLTFLVPDIHERPTGGNIYNRRIITELRSWIPTDVVQCPPDADTPPSIASATDTIVVDSLLVPATEALRRLRSRHADTTIALLAHYLRCIDPNEQGSEPAATERAVLPLFDGVITTSHYAKSAIAHDELSRPRVAVVPPGLDDPYRRPVTEGGPADPPQLLTVANLLPGKGLQALLESLEDLQHLAWEWTLVGDRTLDPAFAEAFDQRLRTSPIEHRVTCTGALPASDLRAHYDRSDVFVLPSRFETCSMAMREAMARGLPVAGYDVGGLAENLGESDGGYLVPANNPAALTDALKTLVTDPVSRVKMGRSARERSRAFPTWPETSQNFRSFLHAL